MLILRSLRGMAAAVAVAACVLGTTTASIAATDPTSASVVRKSTGQGIELGKAFTLANSYANAILSLSFSSFKPTGSKGWGQIAVEVLDAAKNIIATFSSPIYTSATGETDLILGSLNFAPGKYFLKIDSLGSSSTFSKDVTATASFGAPTPVPGPIAAAGLPGLLALAGFGLYRCRNRAA